VCKGLSIISRKGLPTLFTAKVKGEKIVPKKPECLSTISGSEHKAGVRHTYVLKKIASL
jgi:hypothetical protein